MLKRKIEADEKKLPMFEEDEDYSSDSSSSSESEEESTCMVNKQNPSTFSMEKTLVLSSRGIVSRQRHLMTDLLQLLPHAKKETKFDCKKQINLLNELIELNDCTSCLYFEARRHQDLYLWACISPAGPTIKFHVHNIHTLDELNMTGNSILGSRPILSFDETFNSSPQLQLSKAVLTKIFNTPKGHRKSKPFVDRVMSFSVADNKIWVRNLQIADKQTENAKEVEMGLVEIGPRFVLDIMKIFNGSFSGGVIYDNENFVPPHKLRQQAAADDAKAYAERVAKAPQREKKLEESILPKDPVNSVFE